MSAVLTPTNAKPISQPLLTAEEFVAQYEGQRVELVNGVVEDMPMPTPKHGKITLKFGRWLGNWVEDKDLGHVLPMIRGSTSTPKTYAVPTCSTSVTNASQKDHSPMACSNNRRNSWSK